MTRCRARPLSVHIVGLALAMTLPPFLFAIATAVRWVAAEQTRVRATTIETVGKAQETIDRFFAGKIAMLQALATSPSFDSGDFDAFDHQARDLLDLQGLNIVLRDLAGRQIINTRLPRGAPLPTVPIVEDDRRLVESGRPVVTGIYEGIAARGRLIRIMVPVRRGGITRYTLIVSLPPSILSLMLRQSGVVPPFFGSIADHAGLILARSDDREDLIGKPLPGFSSLEGDAGTWSGIASRGMAVFGAYRRSSLSGWTIAAGVDQSVLDQPVRQSIWGMVLLAVLLGLVTVGASILLARRIVVSLRSLARAAESMGDGRVVEAVATPIHEANLIGHELACASSKLHQQAAALAESNRELEGRVEAGTREARLNEALIRATLDNMDQGLMLIDGDGTVPICNRRAMQLLDLPDWLLASRPRFDDILRYQLEQDDFSKSGELLKRWVEGGGLERRLHGYERERPDGTVLEVRTVPLPDGSAVRTYTDITERKRGERLFEHMARHDPLTGLPNRRLFHERLAERIGASRQDGGRFAAFYLDLDRFKVVNDTLGHAAGDTLLCEVADRIKGAAGPHDTVARIGGDEFAVIQLESDQPAAAERLATVLNATMTTPILLDGEPISVGVSIGIAVGTGDAAPDTLFGHADEALYRAKREGRNTFRVYDPGWGTEPGERQSLELNLQKALARGEFELRFQPILAVQDGRITSFEALLRWRHPDLGMVPPIEFITLAEETRLIVPIGAWVLKEACRAAATWPESIGVAVNISAIQIEHDRLFSTVTAALSEAGLAPGRLEIEITESVLAQESVAVLNTLRLLRSIGVRVALDDFGTGYSSLSYLQSFPPDRIKIDRSFVAGVGDRTTGAIMRSIVRLGTELDIAITAEGVETDEQLAAIRQQGCTEVQGYLFSAPVPLADASAMVAEAGRRTA